MQVAKIENNVVVEVIVADSVEWCIEAFGGEWVRTYYNSPGKNFAGVGFIYRPEMDNFSSPSPFPSWGLGADCKWYAPIEYPNDGNLYFWNESLLDWEKAKNVTKNN